MSHTKVYAYTIADTKAHHLGPRIYEMAKDQARAASIRRLATCRRLRPPREDVATSLSLLRSTSSSDAARMIST